MTSTSGQTTMPEHSSNVDPSAWDSALDAVVAAPANHKVLFEDDNLRVLEVNFGRRMGGGARPSSSMALNIRLGQGARPDL